MTTPGTTMAPARAPGGRFRPGRRMQAWLRGGAWLGVWLGLTSPLFALNPERKADSYSIQGWFTEHGLPSNKIRAVTQTRDGYLWMATAQGIARFDGSRFTAFTGVTNPELRGGGFYAVLEAPDGALWFGGDNGLFRWRNGHFDRFTTEQGLAHNYVRALALARDGAIVACTRTGYSLLRDGRITTPGGAWKEATGVTRSYLERADGSILLGTDDGLWRVSGGTIARLSGTAELEGNGFTGLLETPDGSLWIGYSRGVRCQHPDGATENYGAAEGLASPRTGALRFDRDGNLWIATYGGLYRLTGGRIESAGHAGQLGGTTIQQVHEGREGALWVATATGLFRLKDNVSRSIGPAEGMVQSAVYSVFEARDGIWWIGLWSGGVYRYDQTRAERLAVPASLGLDQVLAFAEEPAGTLWIGSISGLYRHTAESTINLYQRDQAAAWQQQLAEQPGVRLPGIAHSRVNSIAADGEGGLWVATDGALYHGQAGRFRAFTAADGLPGNVFKSVIRARNGDIWITAPPFGVARLQEGRWTTYRCGEAIAGIYPRAVYEDSEGSIWVTTEGGGLNRFKQGRWRIFTTRDGLADDFISGLAEDQLGNFWIACPRGVMRIPRAEFAELDAGRRAALQPRIFNRFDGLPAGETNQQGSPSAWQTRDGRLLFATDSGVAVIQPDSLKFNSLVPPMHLERLVVNGVDVDLSRPVAIPPGVNDVAIHYTAISLLAPEKVRFKIRLAPLDRDWVDAGGRREVRYDKLPPGDYTFQAIACNNDGMWNEKGVTLAFTVRPFFYQTGWFIGLVAVTGVVGALGLYWLRTRQARRQLAMVRNLVDERTRELKAAKEDAEAAVTAKSAVILALKQAEKQVAQAHARFKFIFESLPVGVTWMLRGQPDSRIVNLAYSRITGIPVEQHHELDFYRLATHVADREHEELLHRQLVAGLVDYYSLEKRFVHPDGTVRDGALVIRFFRDPASGETQEIGTVMDITERKRAEAELRAKTALLEAQVDASIDGILVVDTAGKKIFQNQRTIDLLKIPSQIAGEIDDKNQLQFIMNRTKDPDLFVEKVRHLFSHPGESSRDEVEFKDGMVLDRYSAPVIGKDGRHYGRIWGFRDITERKRAEEAMRESEERFSGAFEHAPIGVALVAPDGRWLKVNRAVCELVGYSAAELLARTFQDLTHPDDLEADLEQVRRMLAGEIHTYQMEKRYVHARGLLVTALLNVSLVRDGQGLPRYFIAQIQDITARKQTENALRESNEKFHQLADNITDAFWIRSPDMKEVHYVSPAFERIWGRSVESLYANPQQWADFILPEDRERVLRHFAALAGDAPSLDIEYRIMRPDGEVRWVRVRGFQVRDAAGKLIRHIGIVTDITTWKQTEAALEKAHRELLDTSRRAGMAEVATGVLHNVGNVLNSVNVSATLVADHVRRTKAVNIAKVAALFDQHKADLAGFLTRDPRGQMIPGYLVTLGDSLVAEHKVVLEELGHLRKNIEHIKDIVAMQQSYARTSGVIETVAVPDLIEDALRINSGSLARHNVDLFRDYQARPVVTTDKHKVMQILINLVRNAKYACDESGRTDKAITVRTTSDGRAVRIAIVDNGVGIPVENLTLIFNHGFTTKKTGHGFGLHSGALAAKELGGALTVQSAGPGFGATFVLELPLNPVGAALLENAGAINHPTAHRRAQPRPVKS